MLVLNAKLYLPLSIEMLNAVLGTDEALSEVLATLQIPQIACLILIQSLHTNAGKTLPPVERMLADTITVALNHSRREGDPAFRAAAARILDRDKIRAGCELLPEAKILLLDDRDVAFRNYLLPDGSWNPTFCERHRAELAKLFQRVELSTGGFKILTLEQGKIYLELKGHTDDHLHVQGYAGTGKSFLIKSLLQLLQDKNARTLVLAEHRSQLDALLTGVEGMDGMYARTFGEIVREMIPQDLTDPAARRMLREYPPEPTLDDHLVRHLGIYPSGTFSAAQVVKMVRETVSLFCSSDDAEIGKQHIPAEYFWADPATRQVVLHHATELWKGVQLPQTRDFDPRVRDQHRVKWAALRHLTIPAPYTHVLIDECHNLARPMLQILNRSPQPAISLGDEYQNLEGKPHRRSVSLRERIVTHSMRSGRGIEEIVTPIIRMHPSAIKPDFYGNPMARTEVRYYEKAQVPEQPAVVLVSDIWGLFEWAQRLAQVTYFELLSEARNLNIFVEDIVELYEHGTRARHRELFRFSRWDDVTDLHRNRKIVERIDGMLQNGYRINDWRRTSAKFSKGRPTGYALGLVEDARNREFDSVMLAPDIVDWVRNIGDLGQASSAVYVAATRAQRRLSVPQALKDWLRQPH